METEIRSGTEPVIGGVSMLGWFFYMSACINIALPVHACELLQKSFIEKGVSSTPFFIAWDFLLIPRRCHYLPGC